MSDAPSGFSFGKPPLGDEGGGDAANGEDAAVEVSGEPVSRNEAKKLGVVSLDSTHERKASTSTSTALRPGKLPSGVSGETVDKVDLAWQYLKRNEIDQALTTAQEVVWEHPDLVAPKLIIARCFMAREEYEKALNLLQSFPNVENEPEVLYYMGLSQSRLGKVREALKSLNISRATTGDSVLKKRASDLIAYLQGEKTDCPVCGKKTLYESMSEVGDQTVCADCAGRMAAEMDNGDYGEDGAGGKRRKRLRPPLSRGEMLARLLLFLIIVGCVMAVLFYVSPAFYNQLRNYLPPSLRTYVPRAEEAYALPISVPAPEPADSQVVPTLVFSSPPLARAIAGVEINHRAHIEMMERENGAFGVAFNPVPEGGYTMDRSTGTLRWTPAAGDAGKKFTVTFSAEFTAGNVTRRAVNQQSEVLVASGIESQQVADWSAGAMFAHLAAGDVDGDGKADLVIVSGDYWQGEVRLLAPGDGGKYRELTRTSFSGGPVGAGLIQADRETWVAVADFWNARIRYFAFRDGALSELSVTVPLPGSPILADFNREGSVSAALCRTTDGLKAVSFKQAGQRTPNKLGEWPIPDGYVWRRLAILRADSESTPALALFGGNAANSTLYLENEKSPEWRGAPVAEGVLADAAYAMAGGVAARLFMTPDAMRLAIDNFLFAPAGAGGGNNVSGRVVEAGKPPALGGMIMLDLTGDGTLETLFFSSADASVLFGDSGFSQDAPSRWPLAAPPRSFGALCVVPNAAGSGGEALYLSADGGVWALRMVQ